MIPVRIPSAFEPYIVRDDCLLDAEHPLHGQPCPACAEPLGADGLPVALVAIGIAPAARKSEGHTSGGAVAVHTACARPPVDLGAVRREPFLVTVHDQITGQVVQRRVPLNNYIVIPTGTCYLESRRVMSLQRTHVVTIKGVRQPPKEPG
jgi:hypothetical protein